MPIQLFFSNTVEALAQGLAGEIARHHDPFDPITIIVPNPHVQKWIQLRIAEYNGISMNVLFRFFNDGLREMLDYLNPHKEKPSMLEQNYIQLMLFHAIAAVDPGDDRVKLISKYLLNDDSTRKDDYEHKIWQLSSRLSRYFMEYELYREEMIRCWLKGKLFLKTDMEAAQQYLYCTLFDKEGYRDSINRNWFTIPQYWNRSLIRPSPLQTRKFFLFGESHLSPFHAKMIFELGRHLSISLYQVNPCSEFWEDVTTPREDRWHQIRSISIEDTPEGTALKYDEDENPLLKLWGKTGRETIKLLSLIDESGSREHFCTSEWISAERAIPDTTSLSIVQDQILRRTTWNDASMKISQDTSIQIASCPEIFREAESVYNSILHNLEQDSTLRMTDIAIMVPDMTAYGPVLHSVFSREPRRLSYSMIDSTASTDSMFGKAVMSIVDIAAGSFTRKDISGLVRNPCFFEALSMTLNDALVWLSWADKLHIFRGFHKTEDLDPELNLYTWQQGLQRLRLGRIMDTKESSLDKGRFLDFKNIVPYSDINTGDQHCIDTMSSTIELLYAKTSKLSSLQASASEWSRLINMLISEFLTIPAGKREENLIRTNIFEALNSCTILDRLPRRNGAPLLSITAVREIIAETLTGIPSSRGSYLTSGINISALVPKRHIPFRILYIMGMQEGHFPGSSDTSTLNLLITRRMIGDTVRPDINRYHFLETLLAVREKLYITFISKDLQKDQDFHPNSIIGQLMTYLENHVIHDKFIFSHVPSSGGSIDYVRYIPEYAGSSDFIQSSIHGKYNPINFNESDRLVMLQKLSRDSVLNTETERSILQKAEARIPDFSITAGVDIKRSDTESMSLNDLAYFIVNPVESVLRWHLSIYDDNVDNAAAHEKEPFFLIYPHNYTFIINSLNYFLQSKDVTDIQLYIKRYYRHIKLMSITPDGAYGAIDYDILLTNILNRFQNSTSLIEFIHARRNYLFFQTISFGQVYLNSKPDKMFPSLVLPINIHNNNCSVQLKGSLSFLWKNPDTGNCETLVVTNSSNPSIVHLIRPFLFYITSVSNFDAHLNGLIGSGPFTIHISHQKGISSYTCQISETESRHYLQRLINDFLDAEHFDLLPLPVISNSKITQPHEMNDDPDENEIIEYRQTLIDLITDEAEKMFPAYRPMEILELVNPEVPVDAYDKVKSRLGILFKAFAGSTS